MNERIKELMTAAGFGLGSFGFDSDPEMACGSVKDLEKFAELIVDEVYDYILNATFDDEPWPARKDVKKHFGVEE